MADWSPSGNPRERGERTPARRPCHYRWYPESSIEWTKVTIPFDRHDEIIAGDRTILNDWLEPVLVKVGQAIKP